MGAPLVHDICVRYVSWVCAEYHSAVTVYVFIFRVFQVEAGVES